jgi:hypothetical protein
MASASTFSGKSFFINQIQQLESATTEIRGEHENMQRNFIEKSTTMPHSCQLFL